MDGLLALSYTNAAACQHRDELACTGIQHETSDGNQGYKIVDSGNSGLSLIVRLLSQTPGPDWKLWVAQENERARLTEQYCYQYNDLRVLSSQLNGILKG